MYGRDPAVISRMSANSRFPGDGGSLTVSHRFDADEKENFQTKLTELFPDDYDADGKYTGSGKTLSEDAYVDFLWKDLDGDGVPELLFQHRYWGNKTGDPVGYGYEIYKFNQELEYFFCDSAEFKLHDDFLPLIDIDELF